MNTKLNKISAVLKSRRAHTAIYSAAALAMLAAPTLSAQELPVDDNLEDIEVSGIRASLSSALLEKRESTNLVEII